MLWLHTARAKNPERTQIPNQTHLSTSDSYEYQPDISWTPPRHPPDTPQTSPGNKRCQQMPTETKSQPETPQDTDGCCLSMSGSVSWRLLVSFYSWRWQGVSGGHYFGTAWKGMTFFHLTIVRPQNIKMSLYEVDKNDWVVWLSCFLMPVKKI